MDKKICNFFITSSTWVVLEWFWNSNVKIMNVKWEKLKVI
jgi:hypothetical protein